MISEGNQGIKDGFGVIWLTNSVGAPLTEFRGRRNRSLAGGGSLQTKSIGLDSSSFKHHRRAYNDSKGHFLFSILQLRKLMRRKVI